MANLSKRLTNGFTMKPEKMLKYAFAKRTQEKKTAARVKRKRLKRPDGDMFVIESKVIVAIT
jgi:hypothetical protein